MQDIISHRLKEGSFYEKSFLEWYVKSGEEACRTTNSILGIINGTGMSNAERYGCLEFLKTMIDFSRPPTRGM